jgi:hypothetical protein
MNRISKIFWLLVFFCAVMVVLTESAVVISTPKDQARQLTRKLEFDYIAWTLKAVDVKAAEAAIGVSQRLTPARQHQVVVRYFELVQQLEAVQWQIQQIYSDPAVENPRESAAEKLTLQEELQTALTRLDPIVEAILQQQVSETLIQMSIPRLGEALPPVLFHTSATPRSLIMSPRERIEQEVSISLVADMTLEEMSRLEEDVEDETSLSALVVGTGGIGVYPTMIMRTSSLDWVINTIAHEWTHNYLTLRVLGLNYETTPELRTMNETTASIAGNEIGQTVMRMYYPELAASVNQSGRKFAPVEEDAFNFNAEMHLTRVQVDHLLEEGRIDEAEEYMEQRRQVFLEHGYIIRKLNQAYFAFYGAYADSPVSAAGEDPVGEAVRQLRAQSSTLAEFLRAMGRMNSYEDLLNAVGD